jgi:thiamine transport system substrate-binding protein
MKKNVAILLAAAAVVAALSFLLLPKLGKTEAEALVIYTYDSFTAEWGPGPQIELAFEEETGIDLRFESLGDAGQVLQKAIMEKDDPQADILLGIDNNMLAKARTEGVLSPYRPEGAEKIPQHLLLDEEFLLTPYDYGSFSIIYDSKVIDEPPASLEDLTAERFRESLILMDPRTSSPGFGFLLWTIHQYGEMFPEYWKRLEPSILTISEGWDAGYGLFTNGEAPLVLSYTTSPPYHVEYEDSTRYRAAVFEKGHYMQIEGLGIVDGAPHREAAERFVDFALSEEFQSLLPLSNWMYPVIPSVQLPDSFEFAPQPPKSLNFDSGLIAENRERWLETWRNTVSR